ncbi:hypothetical protein HXZ91_05000 [Myroides odoratimimus]|uniref:hypothetical protein n=1 Tax=Myroides odoratimimus TaxID=76832 RepID=UPI0025790F2E|nr:hypothetical protein [Myroides odoratimimus]MDM1033837.1 hypothetical protein [Myroides odoratimimus]
MISSNNINVRNLFLIETIFNKKFESSEGFKLPSGGAMAEIVLNITVPDPNSYVTVIRQGASHSDVYNPVMYDQSFNEIINRRVYLNKTGMYTFYVDLKTLETSIVVTKGEGNPVVEARVGLYNSKELINRHIINNKTLTTIKFNKESDVDDTVNNFPVKGFRYAIFEVSISTGANKDSSIWITGTNKTGNKILELIDCFNGDIYKTSANTNGIVLADNSNKRFFVDLGKLNIESIIIGRNIKGDVIGSVSLVELTNFPPIVIDTQNLEDILFQDNKIKAVYKGKIDDAWGDLIVSTDNENVYISDNIEHLKIRSYNLKNIVNIESSAISYAVVLPYDPNKTNTNVANRIGVVLKTGIMYVNYFGGGGEGDFGRSTMWECMDTNRKILTNDVSKIEDSLYKYDATLTDQHYSRSKTKVVNGKTFIEYQGQNVVQWLGALCRTKKMISWGHYLGDSRRICFFTSTDGGLNWVVGHDFLRRIKPDNYNSKINTLSFSNYTGGLNMSKVVSIFPTKENKEPLEVFTYVSTPFTSITKGASTIVNHPNHTLVDGDIVIFEGTAQDNKWKSLLCDEKTPTYFKQNAYSVLKIDNNSFEIREYLGSYDFPLQIRHIHAVNEVVDGVTISCGEYYPNGWMLLFKQQFKDGSDIVDSFMFPKNNTFRFNSTLDSLQRPCGFIYNNDTDPILLFGSDVSDKNIGNKTKIEGRTETLRRSPSGIWKGKMSDVDEWVKFECVLDIGEPCIWMFQQKDIVIAYFQQGSNAISYDFGNTWNVFPFGTNKINGVYKNNLIIGDGYLLEYK